MIWHNEIDPFAAAWSRELMKEGLVPHGEVDERSIVDVRPADLAGYRQCHFFAGISVWPYALKLAGWPDDREVWTGSCPCPPFSSAGKKFRCPRCDTPRPVPNAVRTGAFNCIRCGHEWPADSRHLWPEFWRLIRDRRPQLVLGEQVGGGPGRVWIDIVRASLEMVGYTVGHLEFPASGVGAPHIRQRLYWVAYANDARLEGQGEFRRERASERAAGSRGIPDGLEHAPSDGRLERRAEPSGRGIAGGCEPIWLADADSHGRDQGRIGCPAPRHDGVVGDRAADRPGPTNGFWRAADWLGCRDDKWRCVEPGLKPLVARSAARMGSGGDPGVPGNASAEARVGRLRGYGNALVAAQATEFISAVMAELGIRSALEGA